MINALALELHHTVVLPRIDRIVMLLANKENIERSIFPMNKCKNASAKVDDKQL